MWLLLKVFYFFFGWISAKVLQQREKWASNPNTLWEKAHERNAKRVLSLIVELGGLWVKLGQYMSTRADVLPDAYISRLKLLQDSLPPRPLQEVFFYPTHIYIIGSFFLLMHGFCWFFALLSSCFCLLFPSVFGICYRLSAFSNLQSKIINVLHNMLLGSYGPTNV